MTIPVRDQKILWGRASGRCSYPNCAKTLVGDRSAADREVIFGEAAHIVAEQPDGPRGDSQMSLEDRNRYANLILLCEEHHTLVDNQPGTYPVSMLLQFKRDHEEECERRQDREPNERAFEVCTISETGLLHATLMPVTTWPKTVYSSPTDIIEPDELKREHQRLHDGRRPPVFILRAKRLWTFDDLRLKESTFAPWILQDRCEPISLSRMERDPDLLRYYIALMNRVVHKIAGARKLAYDADHKRWHFPPNEGGGDRLEKYVPPNQRISARRVAWRPTSTKTHLPRDYWEHLAIQMHFHRAGPNAWFLVLRPERHFTRDGHTPFHAKGRRASSRAAHLYNWTLLGDAHFWRGFLARHEPRIIWNFGAQSLVVEAQLAQTTVLWPGVPKDHKDFANAVPEDDLFSQAALGEALNQRPRDDFEDDDEDGLPELDA